MGGYIYFSCISKLKNENSTVKLFVNNKEVRTEKIINAAGGFAANLARNVGVGKEYVCLPFLGAYRKSTSNISKLTRLIYPVPNPVNPFLGVHTTNTINGDLKIGPTAFPVVGKEQYKLIDGFKPNEIVDFARASWALLNSKSTNYLNLAKTELLKQFESNLKKSANHLSEIIDQQDGWGKYPAGIRSQIVNINSRELEMDYIVRSEKNATHVLNAVSPGWTSSLPFGRWVVETIPSH
jgi:L-2-hydroxyglutarate oxidase LhgO